MLTGAVIIWIVFLFYCINAVWKESSFILLYRYIGYIGLLVFPIWKGISRMNTRPGLRRPILRLAHIVPPLIANATMAMTKCG